MACTVCMDCMDCMTPWGNLGHGAASLFPRWKGDLSGRPWSVGQDLVGRQGKAKCDQINRPTRKGKSINGSKR